MSPRLNQMIQKASSLYIEDPPPTYEYYEWRERLVFEALNATHQRR